MSGRLLRRISFTIVFLFLAGMPGVLDPLLSAEPVQLHPAPQLLPITYPNGTQIMAELAATRQARARGLMFREHLPADRGMLFVFEGVGRWAFWMKNTHIPLDILWISPGKRIVDMAEKVPGCAAVPCPYYAPRQEALYVLELPAGSAKRHQLTVGARLQFAVPTR